MKKLFLSLVMTLMLLFILVMGNSSPAMSAQQMPLKQINTWFAINPTHLSTHRVMVASDNHIVITRFQSSQNRHLKLAAIYFKRSSAYDIAISEILNFYQEIPANLEIHVYFTDYDEELTQQILNTLLTDRTELVFSMGSDTTDFLWEIGRGLDLPFVTVASKDPVSMGYLEDIDSTSNNNFAFTSLNMPNDIQFVYLEEFLPRMKNVVILVNTNNDSAMRTQAIPLQEIAEERGMRVFMVEVDQFNSAAINQQFKEGLRKVVEDLRNVNAIPYDTLFWMTGSTILFERYPLVNSIVTDYLIGSTIPDQTLGPVEETASFGIGVTFDSNGRLAVAYSYEILFNGIDPGTLPIGMVIPPDISINLDHFEQKGISITFSLLEIANLVRN